MQKGNQPDILSSSMSKTRVGFGGGRSVESEKRDVFKMLHDFTRTRPKHLTDKRGVTGDPIVLRSNFVRVKSHPDWLLYQYHVAFDPVVDSKYTRRELLKQHAQTLGGTEELVFDGMILYLSFRLSGTDAYDENKKVQLYSVHPQTQEKVLLTVKLTNELPPNSPQCITVLNLCNRKAFEMMNFRQFGRSFFNPTEAAFIPQYKIEIWPGMISAIRCYEEELLLNVEMAHKLLRTDSVFEYMFDYLLPARGRDKFKDECVRDLVGATVLTRYNNKTYRIDDIDWDKNPGCTFERNGELITYAEYYRKEYSKTVKHMNQPLLLSRAKKRGVGNPTDPPTQEVFLIPELCAMTGLTEDMRSHRQIMQLVAQHTRVNPGRRVEDARNYIRTLNQSENVRRLFGNCNLQLDTDLMKVEGRILPPQELEYAKDRKVEYRPESADWSRESKAEKVLTPVHRRRWVMLYPKGERECAGKFFQTMERVGSSIGINVGMPITTELSGSSTAEYVTKLREASDMKAKAEMILAVVPDDNKTRYDAIKKECCLKNPIPSQVILTSSLKKQKILQSVCAKVMLQMNCKMGGELWKVKIPMKKVMVIGYDSYHDSTARGKSVGAAVFSLNPQLTRWYSQCRLHGESGEMIYNLTEFTKKALKKYLDCNGFYPDRIFLYRDGVGEGQIPVVYNVELPQMQKALESVYGPNCEDDGSVKFSFTIVTKRVNTRFFQETSKEFVNPPPGTVVDNSDSKREIRFLRDTSVCEAGDGDSGVLQRDLRQKRTETGSDAETGIQTLSSVLQLARNDPCSRPVPVRPQTGLPGGSVTPQTGAGGFGGQTVFPVKKHTRKKGTLDGEVVVLRFLLCYCCIGFLPVIVCLIFKKYSFAWYM